MAENNHDAHPSIDHLVLLVFEAVLEVVCVSLPGYVIARLGHFDAEKQKFLANLNVMLFTPCLIFTKLASQLNADKLVDLAVIPVIFIIQTLVSYVVSVGVSKAFRFAKRPANFVTAMGVFGNSNSLPISLVISLSQTLKGLHWDRIPGDNDDEVAARGILYLLIFQQLGQLVRWSWGYHVLLAPKSRYEEYQDETVEEGRYRDDVDDVPEALIPGLDEHTLGDGHSDASDDSDAYEPAGRTPVAGTSLTTPVDSDDEASTPRRRSAPKKYGNGINGDMVSFPRVGDNESDVPTGLQGCFVRASLRINKAMTSTKQRIALCSGRVYQRLPNPVQKVLATTWKVWLRVYGFLWEFMNPPLWAMLIAIVVASVPDLQRVFFSEGTFVNNSVTRAVTQTGGVAVPLILVVLGANLARNTQTQEVRDPEEEQIGKKLLVASLISRMLLPTLIMAPVLALFAKYVPVSILDDPIFVIVCFLLTGAPSALQLAQICQINEVYEGVMSKILFQSYVIWILPSTLVLVMIALETVEWAQLSG
ncbi:auxin efflux carrier [Hypoxylon fragiforme]|uniref:auxin efflux carrier n=1 Tax=Hypoxylon fragiforme TaxID=63214 RepID=UPI0020C718B5|nr:auxin efflux carrier [Hypoxylon fragiforme]KAI2604875.1 auxin efflux carrier [Hypoxylon fragiforme]